MKTTSIEINGKRYLLCFSLRVIRSCTERYKIIEEIGSAIDSEDKLQNVYESVWIIAEMMKAGERYAKLNGLDAPEALSEDVLLDVFDVRDAALLVEKIQETILAGKAAEIEAEYPKNAEATWFLWYGMRVGLTMDETLDIPFGDLLTLIAVEQIKREGCRQKRKLTDDEIIPDVR